jgi:hypothetical protein
MMDSAKAGVLNATRQRKPGHCSQLARPGTVIVAINDFSSQFGAHENAALVVGSPSPRLNIRRFCKPYVQAKPIVLHMLFWPLSRRCNNVAEGPGSITAAGCIA